MDLSLLSSAWPMRVPYGTAPKTRRIETLMPGSESRSMKRWRWAILICELALFALILILPQVALPDCTAQDGISPGAVQIRRFSSPPRPAIALVLQTALAGIGEGKLQNHILNIYFSSPSSSRLSFLCTLIC